MNNKSFLELYIKKSIDSFYIRHVCLSDVSSSFKNVNLFTNINVISLILAVSTRFPRSVK